MKTSKNISTFIGCDAAYKNCKMAIIGVPFDGTTSYRPGARFASSAMRVESYGIETFSPYLDKDLLDVSVFDCGDLELPFGNTKKVLQMVKSNTEKLLNDGKFPLLIGGEHLISLGSIQAVYERYNDLCVVHFDAHADLRQQYLGEKLSHSTVMRRCHEFLGDNSIFQFGIRSGEREEFEFARNHTDMTRFNFDGIQGLGSKIGNRPVYFTIDMDVLDSGVFSGTGTPEAGGVSFKELITAIGVVSKLNIVACDMVELSPPLDNSGASTALACKTLRELILNLYK